MNSLKKLQEIGKRLFERGLTYGSGGNISVKDGDRVTITRSGVNLGFLGEDDFVVLDLEGNVIEGDKPSSETPLHLFLYKNLNINAVIHAHPIYSLLFFSRGKPFKPLGNEGRVILSGFRTVFDKGPNITNFEGVLDALRSCPVTFVVNHGSVAVGENLEEAFTLTDLLEMEAKALFLKGSSPFIFSKGRFSVEVDVFELGEDLVIVLGGSERPHVGGVSVSEMVEDINHPGRKTHTISSISLKGHKDEAVLRMLSESLSRATGKNVVAVGGVHWDGLSEKDIKDLMQFFKNIAEELPRLYLS